ncbi:MAG: FAD:protein FMN transferase [Clostridiales bacterium]|nr:FAD:protein FMN transferase [Clostridiales bacterium]
MFFGTFDTAITIIGFAESKTVFDELTAKAEQMFNEYHRQFNQYYPYEGLHNLYYLNNNAGKAPVVVQKELFDLLSWCKTNQPKTKGRVNIALGTVLSLWHDERENAEMHPDRAKLPEMEHLLEAAKHTNFDDVVLDQDKQTVFYADPLLKLDLGAVAKGYATELVSQYLLHSPMPNFIVNAGGNVRAGLPPLDGRDAWGIGIQDPDVSLVLPGGNDIIDVLYLSDMSSVTSGDYQRYFTVDGVRYHHLVAPDTLMPPSYIRSVTIITQDSGIADLLSTAVFLMPFEEGYAFVESLPDVEALWVLNDRSIKMTKGAETLARSVREK